MHTIQTHQVNQLIVVELQCIGQLLLIHQAPIATEFSSCVDVKAEDVTVANLTIAILGATDEDQELKRKAPFGMFRQLTAPQTIPH